MTFDPQPGEPSDPEPEPELPTEPEPEPVIDIVLPEEPNAS